MNKLIVDEFKLLVKQLELANNDSNKYKISAFNNAINIIENYPDKIIHGSQLDYHNGIGRGTINRVNEILTNGSLKEIKIDRNNYDTDIPPKTKPKTIKTTIEVEVVDEYTINWNFTCYLLNICLILMIMFLLDLNKYNIILIFNVIKHIVYMIHDDLITCYEYISYKLSI
jgi:hypothetical protein